MNLTEFKNKLEDLISQTEDVIEEMPQKGNNVSECQKMNLKQALNEFSYCVNGTTINDLLPNTED